MPKGKPSDTTNGTARKKRGGKKADVSVVSESPVVNSAEAQVAQTSQPAVSPTADAVGNTDPSTVASEAPVAISPEEGGRHSDTKETQGNATHKPLTMSPSGSDLEFSRSSEQPTNGHHAESKHAHAGEPHDLYAEIRHRAYEIYLERGSVAGNEHEDWVRAEREVRSRHRSA